MNKLFVPEISVLIEYSNTHTDTEFYNMYIKKRDAFIGSIESIDFLNDFQENYKHNK